MKVLSDFNHQIKDVTREVAFLFESMRCTMLGTMLRMRYLGDEKEWLPDFGAFELFGRSSGHLLLCGILPELQSVLPWRPSTLHECCGDVGLVPALLRGRVARGTCLVRNGSHLIVLQLHWSHLHPGESTTSDPDTRQQLHPCPFGLS